jgi:agmatine/peptidylarginine deiminase
MPTPTGPNAWPVETTYVACRSRHALPAADHRGGRRALRAHVRPNCKRRRRSGAHPFRRTAYDDTWLRDSGPITLRSMAIAFQLTDFRFTGWGGKFGAEQDDALIAGLVDAGVFGHAAHKRIDWALEGGGIESDGEGTVLTTWRCLVQRHPEQSREEMSAILRDSLHASACCGSITAISKATTPTRISTRWRASRRAIASCSRPATMQATRITTNCNAWAKNWPRCARRWPPVQLYPLPWAKPIVDEGRRLAASYANYLIVNGAVLVPAYGDRRRRSRPHHRRGPPGTQVVQVPCRPLIWQNGSLHCITMQLACRPGLSKRPSTPIY